MQRNLICLASPSLYSCLCSLCSFPFVCKNGCEQTFGQINNGAIFSPCFQFYFVIGGSPFIPLSLVTIQMVMMRVMVVIIVLIMIMIVIIIIIIIIMIIIIIINKFK